MDSIKITNDGYVNCKSRFYTSSDLLFENDIYSFHRGENILRGEIDSGVWAVSYLLSMYTYAPKDFVLFQPATAEVDGATVGLDELSKKACYMDYTYYPLFRSRASVRQLIKRGLNQTHLTLFGAPLTVDDVCEMFMFDDERSQRRIAYCGNESVSSMAAVGYAFGREIFCYPWHSVKRFNCFRYRFYYAFELFERLGLMAIVPVGEGEINEDGRGFFEIVLPAERAAQRERTTSAERESK